MSALAPRCPTHLRCTRIVGDRESECLDLLAGIPFMRDLITCWPAGPTLHERELVPLLGRRLVVDNVIPIDRPLINDSSSGTHTTSAIGFSVVSAYPATAVLARPAVSQHEE
jgi:hypothetical protein